MPDFILNTPRKPHPYYDLDDFAKGYVEAMFFTDGDTGDGGPDRLNRLGVARLTKAAVRAIKADCDMFQEVCAPLLALALEPGSGYCDQQAGRDFWFTRNGHGAGFWDREELHRDIARRPDGTLTDQGEEEGLPFLDSLGHMLSDEARKFGEVIADLRHTWIHYG